jgi:hypothetical protein
MTHEVLARNGRREAAVLWEEAFTQATRERAAEYLEDLSRLERTHGVRLGTVADRIREQFIRPLAVDRLCALIEPAMAEAQSSGEPAAFAQLREELRTHASQPTGVGLDVPHWLRRLEGEVRRVRASHATVAVLATHLFQVLPKPIAYDDLLQQLQDWEDPLAGT